MNEAYVFLDTVFETGAPLGPVGTFLAFATIPTGFALLCLTSYLRDRRRDRQPADQPLQD